MARAADVAADEHAPHRCPVGLQQHSGRSQDVSRALKLRVHARRDLDRAVERHGSKLLDRLGGVRLRVQREGGMVLREAVPVRVVGLFLLEPSRVVEHDLAELSRACRQVDRATEAVGDERGGIAEVIEMRVRHDHGVDGRRVDRKRLTVAQAEILEPLEQTRVDEDARVGGLDEEAAPGHGSGRAEERQQGWEVPYLHPFPIGSGGRIRSWGLTPR